MIPVVSLSYFIKLAVKTVFRTFFSKSSAIVFLGVLITAFFQIGYFVLLDKITDFIQDGIAIDDGLGENVIKSPFWIIVFDVFNFEYLLVGITIILGIALEFVVLIPSFIGLIFGGAFAYGGTIAIRKLISHIADMQVIKEHM